MPPQSSRRYDAIFFDAGYTLVRPSPPPTERYARICREFGGTVADRDALIATLRRVYAEYPQPGPDSPPEHYATSDEIDRAWWRAYDRRVFEAHGVPGDRLDAAADAMYGYFGAHSEWELYPETVPTLEALRADGLTLGVCSNWSSGLQGIIDAHGLRPYFSFVHTSAEVGELKPGARMFELGLAATGFDPARVLHVGDSYDADIIGAGRVGIRGVLVKRRDPVPDAAELVIDDLSGLLGLLGA